MYRRSLFGCRILLRGKVLAGWLTESEAILREADVQTSTFSYLLGTSMNKKFPTL